MNVLLLGLLCSGPSNATELGAWLDDEPLAALPLHLPAADPPLCNDDQIIDPAQLPFMPELFSRWDSQRSWGTTYMVDALVAVAHQVHVTVPDADPMFFADLSSEDGGWLYGHRTHRNGLDADIGLYSGDRTQLGLGDVHPRRLDVETTWLVIDTLLSTERVDYILLDGRLIDTMKNWLVDSDVLTPAEVEATFPPVDAPNMWEMVDIVRPAARHRNHMHVRFRCSRWTPDT